MIYAAVNTIFLFTDVAEKEGPVQAEVKKSAPRIIHQVSEPEPETAPTSMDQSEQLAQTVVISYFTNVCNLKISHYLVIMITSMILSRNDR